MISDAEYDCLYHDRPKTRKGRAWLAGYLIRNGRACTRAYDNCFEEGDGAEVLALLMQGENLCADPDMRRMMEEQGAWSRDYDQTPEPEPLAITEAERVAGFRKATSGTAGAAARWQERAAKGMSNDELAKALAYEIGSFGGSGGPDSLCLTYQAAGLKILIGWEIGNTREQPPTIQGQATVAMARELYGIKDPADKQLALF
jgi:hypothetical protein